jgi:hypothetical protein
MKIEIYRGWDWIFSIARPYLKQLEAVRASRRTYPRSDGDRRDGPPQGACSVSLDRKIPLARI